MARVHVQANRTTRTIVAVGKVVHSVSSAVSRPFVKGACAGGERVEATTVGHGTTPRRGLCGWHTAGEAQRTWRE